METALAVPPTPPRAPLTPAGFVAIYEAELRYVWHALGRLGIPERDREDLCHDVFVAFYRGLSQYDPERPCRPWLFGIAFRIASDYRRRAPRRREVCAEAEAVDPAPAADEVVARLEKRRLVAAALEALSLEHRAVFILHELDGYAMPEIAQALSVPLNTCYSRLRLGREQFARAVRRLDRRKTLP